MPTYFSVDLLGRLCRLRRPSLPSRILGMTLTWPRVISTMLFADYDCPTGCPLTSDYPPWMPACSGSRTWTGPHSREGR
eukprot:1868647-Pyramimonas_sp.AAC.1